MKTPDIANTPMFVLVEGDPGSGKTTFTDTANDCERTAPALHIDMRGNTIALKRITTHPHYVIQPESVADLSLLYNWLGADQPTDRPQFRLLVDVLGGPPKFQAVIVDTLSEFHNMLLDDISGNKDKVVLAPMRQPEIQHWGELLRRTTYFVQKLQELGIHVFITVQSVEDKDAVTGAITHRPQLWGQSAKIVPAYVYVHTYLIQTARLGQFERARMKLDKDLPDETRVALFTPRFDSMAKDQYGLLGAQMVDPTVAKMAALIYG